MIVFYVCRPVQAMVSSFLYVHQHIADTTLYDYHFPALEDNVLSILFGNHSVSPYSSSHTLDYQNNAAHLQTFGDIIFEKAQTFTEVD